MGTLKRKMDSPIPTRPAADFMPALRLTLIVTLMASLLLLTPTISSGITKADKRKGRSTTRSLDRAPSRQLTRAEMKAAEERLAEMGYGPGRVDGVIATLRPPATI